MMRLFLKTMCVWLCIGCIQGNPIAPAWTEAELKAANTAKDVPFLDSIERDVVLYINLARLYPKKFMEIEVKEYAGTDEYVDYVKNSTYKASLIKQLKTMKALPALMPNDKMSSNADCFALESGKAGLVGHQRIKCPKMNWAECCSYGMRTGRDVAMQLLIDDKVASLGHRTICLDPTYSQIGVGFAPHKKWDYCCVLEVI